MPIQVCTPDTQRRYEVTATVITNCIVTSEHIADALYDMFQNIKREQPAAQGCTPRVRIDLKDVL